MLHHPGLTTFPNSTTSWRKVFKHESLWETFHSQVTTAVYCLCVHVHACVYSYMFRCMCVCRYTLCALWKAEVSSGWHVSSDVHLISEIMSFTGLEAANQSKPASLRNPISTSPAIGLRVLTTISSLFIWVLGTKLTSSCLQEADLSHQPRV